MAEAFDPVPAVQVAKEVGEVMERVEEAPTLMQSVAAFC